MFIANGVNSGYKRREGGEADFIVLVNARLTLLLKSKL
jgi:hypothetical protein